MKCPSCGYGDSKVIDSRPDDSSIKRRRECLLCHKRFNTYETIEIAPIIVLKKNGTHELFDKNKILTGLIKSCYKRPVSREQLEKLVDSVEQSLISSLKTEVTSSEIGALVMDGLRDLDEVAYVRFASVYREFKDIDTFLQAINQLLGKQNSK
jgi:transcriptional repressor NrdR